MAHRFKVDYARLGSSSCKKCKQKLEKGSLRLAKVTSNPFSDDGGDMNLYHHPSCLFETFIKARATTKIIEDLSDVENIDVLNDDDLQKIKELIAETLAKKGSPKTTVKKTPKKTPKADGKSSDTGPSPQIPSTSSQPVPPVHSNDSANGENAAKDNSFRSFRRLCAEIADEPSYKGKTELVSTYLKKGSSGNGFEGDLYLLLKLLLPGVVKTVYNLNSKQLVKCFSQIFGSSLTSMQEDLEQGDVAETVRVFFEQSTISPPQKKCTLSIQEVHGHLMELSKYTKEDDQTMVLQRVTKMSTANDLKMFVRLIKHDLRINSGAKHILDALDPNAYQAFQASRDLKDVVDRWYKAKDIAPGMVKKLSVRANLMTPILPMLAEACKSVDMAFKKCPNGMYAEIKYDGERVQVHKQGDSFSYFSRSLKPVLPHKVNHFKDYIPLAFPHGNDIILDAEVLLIDTNTSKPLPFGTLGVHKKTAFNDAKVGLFIFDCIHFNGESLINKPIKERRKFLRENMKEVPHRILFSEMKHITKQDDLKDLIMRVLREGLEGLVLKDINGIYEPGKRHWLKVKKDYLAEGAMADTADLVVLGAYFGTGNKGGMMSVFLMGCHDEDSDEWCTVTKVHGGFDDKALEKLQTQFDMIKTNKDYTQVPSWLRINKSLMPDFIVRNPKKSFVWEITGAEFSKSDAHTASGISIRFPRCTKIRDDKSVKDATSLSELKTLYTKSKEHSDIPDLIGASTVNIPTKKSVAYNSDDDLQFTPLKDESPTLKTIPHKRHSSPSADSPQPKKEKKALYKNDSDDDLQFTPERNIPHKKHSNPSTDSPQPKKNKIPLYKSDSDDDLRFTPEKDFSPSTKLPHSKKDQIEKVECKYGSSCYQINEQHRKKYSHPGDKHLPDVFTQLKFYLEDDLPSLKKLKRYIIAFDGDVLQDYEKYDATHFVVKDKASASTKEVPAKWVWDCIKQKTVLPLI